VTLPRKVLCSIPGGGGDRRKDRPKLRRCDEVEEDVARVGCRNWTINPQSREEWRKLIEEVKSYVGL
jgi:hypothetical protein